MKFILAVRTLHISMMMQLTIFCKIFIRFDFVLFAVAFDTHLHALPPPA